MGQAYVVISCLPGEPSDFANDEAVREVLDALAAVELTPELVALLDEPLHHAGGPKVAETITELVFPLLTDDERGQAEQVLALAIPRSTSPPSPVTAGLSSKESGRSTANGR